MITIRPLSPQDSFSDLFSLSRQFFQEYQGHHPDFFALDRLEETHVETYFAHFLSDPDSTTFIALDCTHLQPPIIAYLTLRIKRQPDYWSLKHVGEISGLMVSPVFRRKGIASHLLYRAWAYLAGKGIRYITVYTAVANHAALSFYRAHGLLPLHTTLLGQIDLE